MFGFGVTVGVIVAVVVAYRRRREIRDWLERTRAAPAGPAAARDRRAAAPPLVRPVTHVACPTCASCGTASRPASWARAHDADGDRRRRGSSSSSLYLTSIAQRPGPDAARHDAARPGRPHPQRHARGRRQGRDGAGRVPDRRGTRGGHRVLLVSASATPRRLCSCSARAHLPGGERHQGRARAASGPAARSSAPPATRYPERSRGVRDCVDRGRRGAHAPAAAGRERRARLHRAGDRRGGRDLARLPARTLVVRRGRRLGAGRWDIRGCWRR